VFDFWLLFFNGDGCFLRWGNNCWIARTIPERDHMTYMDNTALFKKPNWSDFSGAVNTMLTFSQENSFTGYISEQVENTMTEAAEALSTGDIFAVGRGRRSELADTCPGLSETKALLSEATSAITEAVKGFVSNADF
jgi:hypothetical protein